MLTANERFKLRNRKNRPMTTITIHIPEDALDELKEFAPRLGFTNYETLVRAFISEGMFKYEGKMMDAEGELIPIAEITNQAS